MPDYNWITANVALGSAPTPSDVPRMQTDGITDVLDLRSEADSTAMYAGTGINYHRVPMIDDGRRQPASAYQQGVQIIYNALASSNGRVLVQCAAGQYRSPSMVYAYLRSTGMTADQAWSTIVAARPSVHDQYVSSAEAAVPSLPTSANGLSFLNPYGATMDSTTTAVVALAAAVFGGYLIWELTKPAPRVAYARANPRRSKRRHREIYA